MSEHPKHERSVLVTGASTGIGRACTLRLARLGWRVYAGIRSHEAAANLHDAAGPEIARRIVPLRLDVTDPQAIDASRDRVRAELDGDALDGLVNNAGTTIPCPVEYLSLDEFRRQLEVNLTGPFAVTKAFLPLLRRPGGRIVNVSSPGAKIAAPFMAPYVAAKAGLEGLSGVLRSELRPAGIHVAVIEPGYVATGMREKLRRDADLVLSRMPEAGIRRYADALRALTRRIATEADHGAHPDVVARVIERALTESRPRTRYPAGRGARPILLLARLLPDRALDRVITWMLKLPAPFDRATPVATPAA